MGNGPVSKTRIPGTLFQWVGLAVVVTILLAFWLGTKMLFVAGGIILIGFSVGVVQSAIHLRRTLPSRGVLSLLPHASLLVLVALLLWILGREMLRQ